MRRRGWSSSRGSRACCLHNTEGHLRHSTPQSSRPRRGLPRMHHRYRLVPRYSCRSFVRIRLDRSSAPRKSRGRSSEPPYTRSPQRSCHIPRRMRLCRTQAPHSCRVCRRLGRTRSPRRTRRRAGRMQNRSSCPRNSLSRSLQGTGRGSCPWARPSHPQRRSCRRPPQRTSRTHRCCHTQALQ